MDKLNSNTIFDLDYFFEMTPDLLFITGFDGYLKKVNPAVSKTLGYTDEELFSSLVSTFVHPDDQEITNHNHLSLTNGDYLVNFENRFITKDGPVVWLSWTSVPISRDKLIFGIARNITYRKQLEEYDRISSILAMINDDHHKRFNPENKGIVRLHPATTENRNERMHGGYSQADQFWLNSFETCVRKHAGQVELNLTLISSELAISQRQLFRRVDQLLGITPNKFVRIIRLQLAWEAIASGKYRTITEISNIAGYNSRSHFSKLFKEVYGIHVAELL